MNKIFHYFLSTLFVISIFLFTGCEDDALLVPQTDSECEGSYCSLGMPESKQANLLMNPTIF